MKGAGREGVKIIHFIIPFLHFLLSLSLSLSLSLPPSLPLSLQLPRLKVLELVPILYTSLMSIVPVMKVAFPVVP